MTEVTKALKTMKKMRKTKTKGDALRLPHNSALIDTQKSTAL